MRNELYLRTSFVNGHIKLLSTKIWQIKNQFHYVKQFNMLWFSARPEKENTALQINSSISHTGFCLMSFVTDNLINLALNSPLEIQE